MDIKVFVDTDADIRLTRLIERDTKERGLSLEYIIEKYKTTLKPMYEKYVEPSKKKANIIISGKDISVGAKVLIEAIKNVINS